MWKKSYTKDIDIDVSVTFRLTAVFDSTFTHARAHTKKNKQYGIDKKAS